MIAGVISLLGIMLLAVLVGVFRGLGKHVYDRLFKKRVDSEIERRRG